VAPADVALVGGDAADAIRVLPHPIRAEPGQGGAHLVRVFLIDAEDDRFGEGVRLAEEFGQVAGDGFRAGL
jgi:hypothetical protein